jgi:hypothetical protein
MVETVAIGCWVGLLATTFDEDGGDVRGVTLWFSTRLRTRGVASVSTRGIGGRTGR